jgi:alpha-galactosidase
MIICVKKTCGTLALILCFFTFVAFGQTDGFQDLTRPPDGVSITTETGTQELQASATGVWKAGKIEVMTQKRKAGLGIKLIAPTEAIKFLQLHWNATLPPGWLYLGDAWERAYGDLAWKPLDGRRVMPWYFLASNGTLTHGYGVKTGPSAFCYWTADATGITLQADVRCGGVGVELGQRTLDVCVVVCRRGKPEETSFEADREFCADLCPDPRLPKEPVYGFNDWYCSYGKDTAEEFLKNAAYMVSLAPKGGVRPFAVVDDGWEISSDYATQANAWNEMNPKFSTTLDMRQFAGQIRTLGARPGLWYRPLIASTDCPPSWRLSRDTNYLDPTVPEVRAYIRQTVRRFHGWGFELIKHDFTTDDLFGRWGFEMGNEVTPDGWAFRDRSKTSAEIVKDLYRDIREAAGNGILITGCDTIGHLSAGIFEMQRIGDDTSGRDWSRTRKMGVNGLAFRAPQNGTFFAVDADCVGQTTADSVPWEKNRQWLELLSHSGTVVFTSFPRNILDQEQEKELRSALGAAARKQPLAEPLDWQQNGLPALWQLDGRKVSFNW